MENIKLTKITLIFVLTLFLTPFLSTSIYSVDAKLQDSFTKDEQKEEKKLHKPLTKEERKEKIKKIKFSFGKVKQEQIDELSDEMIEELSKNDGEIVSITQQDSTVQDSSKEVTLSQLRAMPKTDYSMTLVAQRISEKGSSYDNFKFTAEGRWLVNPFWELTDSIAVGWSDNFVMYNDYATHYGLLGAQQYAWSCTRDTIKNQIGVGYDVDLKSGCDDWKTILVAKVYKNNGTGVGSVKTEYMHTSMSPSNPTIGISLGSDSKPQFSFSVSGATRKENASPAYADFTY